MSEEIRFDGLEKSKARKIKLLFKKYKKLIRSYYETANFNEPILILLRRSNKAEFHEKATAGIYEYKHSDGEDRKIFLNPKYQQTFDYGNKVFRGYICHEDFPLPLPQEPLVTSEEVGIAIDKTLHDIKEWKAKELRAQGDLWWKILIGIAIIIIAIGFVILIKPPASAPTQTVVETVKTVTPVVMSNISSNVRMV